MRLRNILLIVLSVQILLSIIPPEISGSDKRNPDGAWVIEKYQIRNVNIPEDAKGIMLIAGDYYYWSLFDVKSKAFYAAAGGTFKKGGNTVEFTVEFHTLKPELVGQRIVLTKKGGANKWQLTSSQGIYFDMKRMKEKVDSPLKGAWRITERERNGTMTIMPEGSRKTIKMLSDARFQWAAFNSETGEFFGTGGGTYSVEDGKYTENIEFFSRDNSRVGQKLSFDYETDEVKWKHSGLSSRGDKINEVWTKISETD
ncbi:MAG: membrane or secreted protein [Bacteroidetes bacterium]|nr:membrane or secreted protein [Bacteroidota bacterium]